MVGYDSFYGNSFIQIILSQNVTLRTISDKFSKQNFYIYFTTLDNDQNFLFNAWIDPSGVIPPKPPKKGIEPWEIALYAVGGVIILGVIVFAVCKIKSSKPKD